LTSFRGRVAEMGAALILIVEDNFLIASDMQRILEEAGYKVLGPASNFDRAMALVKAFHPDIVLLDIELPGSRNGVAIARELLKLHIPALFVSAIAPHEVDAKDSAIGLLSKPIDEKRLLGAIRLVEEVAAGKTPSLIPDGFQPYRWRRERNGKSA
jgi:two-component system, response regulator PdtaR